MFTLRRSCLAYGILTVAAATQGQISHEVEAAPEVLHIAPAPSERFPEAWYPSLGDGHDVVPAPVLNTPYTATLETTRLQKGSTGEVQEDVTRTLQARDRLGRVRMEVEMNGLPGDSATHRFKLVAISDPVTHCQFRWKEPVPAVAAMPADLRIAYVSCGPQTLRYKDMDLAKVLLESLPDETVTQQGSIIKNEHLAPLHVYGITVDRIRSTHSDLDQNGQTKQWILEQWYSPDLRELIRSGDSEEGFRTLTDIQRSDPNPELFYPPKAFRIESVSLEKLNQMR